MNFMRFLIKIFSIGCVIFFFLACTDTEKMKEEMVQTEIQNRVKDFELRRRSECLTAALDSANRIVDSLILVKMTSGDSSATAGKPIKPLKPLIKSPLDTTPVVPILEKDSFR